MISKRAATPRTRGRRSRSSASDADLAGDAWQHATRWLAAHDRSEDEIRRRLSGIGVSTAIIDATVRRLQDLRFLDDQRYAESFAEQAEHRGHGSEYVRAHLVAKGVAETLIEAAIGARFEDERSAAHRVLARQYPSLPQRPRERAKAARFLLRRGFPEDVVFAILGEDC